MAEVPSFAHKPRQVVDEGTYETNIAEINNILQYSIALNDTQITPVKELYYNRANLEKLLTGPTLQIQPNKFFSASTIERYIFS